MKTFSHYGVGVKVHAIEPQSDGRVAFTLWFTVCFIPLIPLSSWSALYAGEFDGPIQEDGHAFTDLVRIERGLACHVRTWLNSIVILWLAISPAGYLIYRTNGRAATDLELVLVFASAAWPVVLVLFLESRRRQLLRGHWTSTQHPPK